MPSIRPTEYGSAITYLNVNNEDSDFFFKGYLDIAQLRASYAAGTSEARDLLAGYAADYNRFLKDNAGKLPKACANAAWVRPISVDDLYLVVAEKALHTSGEAFAPEIVNGARAESRVALTKAPAKAAKAASLLARADFVQRRVEQMANSGLGSNAVALGKDTTVNRRGMLLGNPHYPWSSTDRFYQAHLTVPGRYDAMGVILGGVPVVVIGFNRDLAWTHTVTANHFNTYRLAQDPRDASGTTYLIDGQPKKMSSRTVAIDILQADGTLRQRRKTFYNTELGAVMVKPEAGVTWGSDAVYVLSDPNRSNTRMIEQWLRIGSARNVGQLKYALDNVVACHG